MEIPPVRDRSNLPGASRKVEFIAPEEIRRAMLHAIGESGGMSIEETPTAVCKLFGFARVTDEMRAEIEPHVEVLIKTGHVKVRPESDSLLNSDSAVFTQIRA
jgi:hypothetical protein